MFRRRHPEPVEAPPDPLPEPDDDPLVQKELQRLAHRVCTSLTPSQVVDYLRRFPPGFRSGMMRAAGAEYRAMADALDREARIDDARPAVH